MKVSHLNDLYPEIVKILGKSKEVSHLLNRVGDRFIIQDTEEADPQKLGWVSLAEGETEDAPKRIEINLSCGDDMGKKVFVFLHEILHIYNRHFTRIKEHQADRMLWNVVTDCLINETLDSLGVNVSVGIMGKDLLKQIPKEKLSPLGVSTPKDILDKLSAEQLYDLLKSTLPKEIQDLLGKQIVITGEGNLMGDGQGKEKKKSNLPKGLEKEIKKALSKMMKDKGEKDKDSPEEGESEDDNEQGGKTAGVGTITRITKVTEVSQDKFSDMVKEIIKMLHINNGRFEEKWGYNRLFSSGFPSTDLPYQTDDIMDGREFDWRHSLYVYIDVSGSVSSQDFDVAVGLTNALLGSYFTAGVQVNLFNTEVIASYSGYEFVKRTHHHKDGGTSFNTAIENLNGKMKPGDRLVFITDGQDALGVVPAYVDHCVFVLHEEGSGVEPNLESMGIKKIYMDLKK